MTNDPFAKVQHRREQNTLFCPFLQYNYVLCLQLTSRLQQKKFLQDNWPAAKDPVPRAKFELEQRTEKPENW